jgi:hypothetical protein
MRYRVLVCAGLAFVPSMPAEAQKLQTALAIVMEQPTMARTMTRERDIIPGLGINREIFADQTGSGETLFHQENVLTGAPTTSDTNGLVSPGSEKPWSREAR